MKVCVAFVILLISSVAVLAQQSELQMKMDASQEKPVTLLSGLGSLHHSVSTKSQGTATESKTFPIDEKKEPLAAALKRNNPPVWPDDDKAFEKFLTLDPAAKYPIVKYGEDNYPLDTLGEITGAELRKSVALITARSKEDSLDAKARKQLALALYDNENGPQNVGDLKKGKERLLAALDNMQGYVAARKQRR